MLSPLSALYWLITSVRNWCYDVGIFKSTSFDIPIISVGNLAVGGSGKTPMVEYLIRELKSEYKIATLSRGYGRKTRGFLWVESNLSANLTGDEPLQIKTKFKDISVAVCEDRVAGVQRILAEKPGTNLIILDDAFQHRAIKPKINLLLTQYSLPYFKDWIMPAGRLRERRSGAKRADAIIYTKCPANFTPFANSKVPTFYSSISYQNISIDESIFGFSALANNNVFENYLKNSYNLVGFKGFRDHYKYTDKDIETLKGLANKSTLVCTEKDYVKVKHLANTQSIKHIVIENEVTGDADFLNWLKNKINHES